MKDERFFAGVMVGALGLFLVEVLGVCVTYGLDALFVPHPDVVVHHVSVRQNDEMKWWKTACDDAEGKLLYKTHQGWVCVGNGTDRWEVFYGSNPTPSPKPSPTSTPGVCVVWENKTLPNSTGLPTCPALPSTPRPKPTSVKIISPCGKCPDLPEGNHWPLRHRYGQ